MVWSRSSRLCDGEDLLRRYGMELGFLGAPTQPLEGVGAEKGVCEGVEGWMGADSVLISDREASVLVQPGENPFYLPKVPSRPRFRFDPFAGDPRPDPQTIHELSAARDVVGPVRMHLHGAPAATRVRMAGTAPARASNTIW